MRVALVQPEPGQDLEANIAQVERLVGEALAAGPVDLIVLPEVWSCLGGDRAAKFAAAETLPLPGTADTGTGRIYAFLGGLARAHGVWVHGGSIGERVSGEADGLLGNTTLVFDPQGIEQARYRKIHLFDVDTPNGDGYRESATFAPGEEIVTTEIAGAPAGLAICYDMRFPELFLALRAAGVKMVVLPAAFTQQTGEAHWDILLRARAIEMQAWVIACGTAGWHVHADGGKRQTYGHSMVIDPWGRVVLQLGGGAEWGVAEIDPGEADAVRARMPVHENRRLI